MIRIGILGSIGSGKTFVANNFGYPVFNADYEVAQLYKRDKKIFNKLNVLFFTAILAGLFLIFYDTISFNDNLSLSKKKAVAIVNETIITEDQLK